MQTPEAPMLLLISRHSKTNRCKGVQEELFDYWPNILGLFNKQKFNIDLYIICSIL